MNFSLDEDQNTKLGDWVSQHNISCRFSRQNNEGNPDSPTGAIGGRFTYEFTPTGLGVCAIVKCACGEAIDLTDVENW